MIPYVPLSLLLGLLSLDITAVGQFMVSRAVVVGPLVGALCGNAGIGLAVGALIELIWIGDLPVGSHLPLDTTLLSGAAAAASCELLRHGVDPGAAVTYALCLSIPMAALSSEAENLLRKLNVKWVRLAQRWAEADRMGPFESVSLAVLSAQYLKGVVMAGMALAVVHGGLWFFPHLPPEAVEGLSYAPWFLMATGCSAAIDLLVAPKHLLPLAFSGLASAVLVVFFRFPPLYLLPVALLAGAFVSLGWMQRSREAA